MYPQLVVFRSIVIAHSKIRLSFRSPDGVRLRSYHAVAYGMFFGFRAHGTCSGSLSKSHTSSPLPAISVRSWHAYLLVCVVKRSEWFTLHIPSRLGCLCSLPCLVRTKWRVRLSIVVQLDVLHAAVLFDAIRLDESFGVGGVLSVYPSCRVVIHLAWSLVAYRQFISYDGFKASTPLPAAFRTTVIDSLVYRLTALLCKSGNGVPSIGCPLRRLFLLFSLARLSRICSSTILYRARYSLIAAVTSNPSCRINRLVVIYARCMKSTDLCAFVLQSDFFRESDPPIACCLS